MAAIQAFAALTDADRSVSDYTYKPRELQPEDVDLRIIASGVCHSDLHQVLLEWKSVRPKRPLVPGHEIVGVVVRAGSKAIHPIGARVAVGTSIGSCGECVMCKTQQENYCAKNIDTYTSVHAATNTRNHGGFAERVVVDSRFAVALPEGLPSTTAAPLMCAGATVYSPLARYRKLENCKSVGVVGIGGLGHLALQFARAIGYERVAAITSSADKAEAARSFGAHDVVVTSDKASLSKFAGAFDLLIVTVSADLNMSMYLRLIATNGRFCLVGLPPSGEIKMNPFAVVGKRISVSGSSTASLSEIREMLKLAAEKHVRVQHEILPLSTAGANKALERVAKNQARFRCVMVPEVAKQAFV